MMMPASAALWFLPFVLPICIWVAWSDLATMKIPNKAVAALILVYLVVGLIALPFSQWAWQLVHFAVVLAVGFILAIVRVLGAGDAKFAAAAAPFIMVADLVNLMAIFAICTIIGFATHRIARVTPFRKLTPNWESWERTRDFPMGYPLAGTLLIYLLAAVFY
ncbi:prepilin peptidase [uncultured Litoreibacter sp.]|uniref:prepilin peptidase n=1 Tax=uncultured Litoreibacter sp. TaxID=1392394 RepID=UPI002604F201|nr:prepilin peptidase [uncultured Litoreibacter sp.]